ncbi:uncharacterized protein [Antennarius striatus]|uniref:uncharacterized protein n=1 Tax=Antennarius striatus TaxID=241820 RepID=UPI0035AFDDBE
MGNITRLSPLKQPIVFELEGLDVPPGYGSLLFILVLINFTVILMGNGVVALVIIIDKNLHRPMFVLVCHLITCDLLGGTAALPHLMVHFLMGQKKIAYAPAITQAFCLHMYAGALQTVQGVMAYDRYVAVCEPLRYPSIMTSARLHTSCALAWIVAFILIGVLFSFHIHVPLCGTTIKHIFCTNHPILRLACIPTPISDIYGLTMNWVLSTSVFLIIAFSYIRILHTSVKQHRGNSSINKKALKTCAPQIVVYVVNQVATLIMVLSQRFPSLSHNMKKLLSILLIIIPPAINPMIYGLVIKELQGGDVDRGDGSVRLMDTEKTRLSLEKTILFCMENITRLTPLKQPIVFELEGFDVPPGYGSLLFILALINYIVVLLGNGVVAFVIIIDKNLHRPMFVMVCHLVGCDLLGGTALLPPIMIHFLMGQRRISYASAIAQAFCLHMYGSVLQTIQGVMAYDRYVAICEPLRYPTIMTSARLHTSCALAWIVAFILIGGLFCFHINVKLCGTTIKSVACSNRSILSLACSPTPINNIYGLTITWVLSTSVFLVVAFSYFRILHASGKRRRTKSSINNKAFRTCAIHIAVYLIHKLAVLVTVLSYRIPSKSPNMNKLQNLLFIIIPPAVNPIIYGLASKELRESIIKHFSKVTHRK